MGSHMTSKMRQLDGAGRDVGVVVSRQLHDLAGHLERLTTEGALADIGNQMPDIVSRLRLLGGVLTGSASPNDYDSLYGDLRAYESFPGGSPSVDSAAMSPSVLDSSVDVSREDRVVSSTRQSKFSFDSDDSLTECGVSPPPREAGNLLGDSNRNPRIPLDLAFVATGEALSPVRIENFHQRLRQQEDEQVVIGGTIPLCSLPKKLVLDSANDSPL